MRFVGVILILIALPAFIYFIRAYPHRRNWIFFAFGVLPFITNWANLDVAIISWGHWLGHTKGLQLSILDPLAIAVIVSSRNAWQQLPFRLLVGAYLLLTILSTLYADLWLSSFFYVFQFVRVALVFVAVSAFGGNSKAVQWLCYGLAAGAIFQAAMAIFQISGGTGRVTGAMGHQNLLGMMLHFVTIPLIALLLAGERSKYVMFAVLASLGTVMLGASRASVAYVLLGVVLLLIISFIRSVNIQKTKIVGFAIMAGLAVAPLAVYSFSDRFGDGQILGGPDLEREAFERAARAMWLDNPMGVGGNQYVATANKEGYSTDAGVARRWGSLSAHVHNVYLLTAAEMGWLGLISLSGLIVWSILSALLLCFKDRKSVHGELVLGFAVAILTMALHSFYEWIFMLSSVQYLFAIALGVIAGSIRAAKRQKRQQPMRADTGPVPAG